MYFVHRKIISVIDYLLKYSYKHTYLFVCVYPVQFYLELKVESKKFNQMTEPMRIWEDSVALRKVPLRYNHKA